MTSSYPTMLLLAVAALAVGCVPATHVARQPLLHGAPFVASASPASFRGIRRVVLMPLEDRSSYPLMRDKIRDEILAQFRAVGMFEIIDGSAALQPRCAPCEVANGQYVESLLVTAYQQLNADAVMFFSINEVQPYSPLGIGCTLHIVETYDAQTIASVDGYWTTANSLTQAHYEQFCSHPYQESCRSNLALTSFDMFSRYVIAEIVGRLDQQITGRPPQQLAALPPQMAKGPNRVVQWLNAWR